MNPLLVFIAATTLGFQVGWKPLPGGGTEYIIQLDAAALDALRDGQPLQSAVPSEAGEIRAYRIFVGTSKDKPERQAPPPKPAPPPVAAPAKPAPVEPAQPSQPPLSWTLTILGLFASLGGNAFLGWIAWGLRRRCQNAR
jgi:hypothetical protein